MPADSFAPQVGLQAPVAGFGKAKSWGRWPVRRNCRTKAAVGASVLIITTAWGLRRGDGL